MSDTAFPSAGHEPGSTVARTPFGLAVRGTCALTVALVLWGAASYIHGALEHRLVRERKQASVTTVGAVLTAVPTGTEIFPGPGAAPECTLPAGGTARSRGGEGRFSVKVEVTSVTSAPVTGSRPAPCVVGYVGYADVSGTWQVSHHDDRP